MRGSDAQRALRFRLGRNRVAPVRRSGGHRASSTPGIAALRFLAPAALATSLTGALLFAGAAGAAVVHSPDTGIAFTAAAGERNEVTIAPSPSGQALVRLGERLNGLRAGFGCAQVDRSTVDCPRRGLPMTVDLGDERDTLHVAGGGHPVHAQGGDGNDDLLLNGAGASRLNGGSGNDRLFGGLANDHLDGGAGVDDLRGDVVLEAGDFRTSTEGGGDDLLAGGPDTDAYAGGPGFDTVSYAHAVIGFTASLPRPPEEGASAPGQGGEGEGLPQDVEGIIGGSGPDSLRGNRAANRLEGGPGNDTLTGESGADLLAGGADGDSIFANDGIEDLISCGPNRTTKPARSDTLDSDLADGAPPADCESVTQGAVTEGDNVVMPGRPSWPRRDGRVGIRLRCPQSVAIGCSGTLRLRLLSRAATGRRGVSLAAARATSYRLEAGRSKMVFLRLSRRDRSALRRAARRARVTSVERGEFGPKTTIRTIRLERSR